MNFYINYDKVIKAYLTEVLGLSDQEANESIKDVDIFDGTTEEFIEQYGIHYYVPDEVLAQISENWISLENIHDDLLADGQIDQFDRNGETYTVFTIPEFNSDLRKNPTQCTDGRYSFAEVLEDDEGNWDTSGICTSGASHDEEKRGRTVQFDEDGNPITLTEKELIKLIKEKGLDVAISYIHPSFYSTAKKKVGLAQVKKMALKDGRRFQSLDDKAHRGGRQIIKRKKK